MPERLSAREVLALVADADGFRELVAPARESRPDGPLRWQGYDASRARAAERTGEQESVVCGTALVEGTRAVLIAFEFGFLGGSLGERTGDRLEAAYGHAREHRLPLVSLIATGGSRMQEGMLALTQLQRVARQSALTREAGLPQIAVLRDPTTGGGWATLGAGADVVLALPGAQVGFAGSRVRPPGADPAAYTAESQTAAGSADAVVPARELKETLGRWLRLLAGPAGAIPGTGPAPGSDATPGTGSAPGTGPRQGTGPMASTGPTRGTEPTPGTEPTAGTGPTPHTETAAGIEPAPVPFALGRAGLPGSGWEAVGRARASERPRARAYLDAYFGERVLLGGDRCGGTDPDGMLCGFGERDGRTVAYAAQTGAATRPAGYRTAARLIRLADRLGVPVLTLVDTPGAANDAEAERQGAGAAIAEVFGAVAAARVPVTTLVIGEGGSGGALALAAPGNTWATPDSYFSVIAPELAAAILKRPPEAVEATADQLRIRPQDLVELGVVRGVVGPADHPGPEPPDHRRP
ncbi:carboxyl transferase domain-containing protein [Streptomyces echinatus]|uniref:Acetyl-coenzyme A carboxylase carboxyl transferase subunits beta/alpha n=1 Tax=Streptomyces echinatus TaxID=67293 RepID=A0A7W9PP00_9ACTN|nr:carboxyl transferase domain-containing protein [Streptomyces echinatus]MBB5925166.1 acetyl-CoA carboxylase carboxyl transferase subunit beta [Streptomyces echinatus]